MIAYRLSRFLIEKKLGIFSKGEGRAFTLKFVGLVFFSFVGAKLAFLFFSSGKLLDDHSSHLSFWLGGGFVFYGGMIGAGLWTFLFIPNKWHSYFIPAAAISHGVGRIGCFLAGCCYGHNHFPIQLVESAGLFLLGFWCLKSLENKHLVSIYLIVYSVFRFCLEFFRADEIRGYWSGLFSSSQVISLLIFVAVLIKLCFFGKRNILNRNI